MDQITVVVETPKGSMQKYNYDPGSHFFNLKKILPAGMAFPYDFGFIPNTKGEDGDPLDCIIIAEFTTFPGCMMKCRLIGALQAEQSEEGTTIRNDRFILVPKHSEVFKDAQSLSDIPEKILKELEDFFVQYNKLQGKKFKPLKRVSAKAALVLLKTQQTI